jgi:hypothetical protein
MKTLDTQDLSAVSGGSTSTNTQMTQALTAVQSSIKDLAANNSNNSSSSNMLLPIMMMAMNRPQPTVVAAAPAATGPVINISNRFRRW